MEKFVIKTGRGTYVGLHSNRKELNFCVTSLELAPKLSQKDVQFVLTNFTTIWHQYDFKIYDIVLTERLIKNPFINQPQ